MEYLRELPDKIVDPYALEMRVFQIYEMNYRIYKDHDTNLNTIALAEVRNDNRHDSMVMDRYDQMLDLEAPTVTNSSMDELLSLPPAEFRKIMSICKSRKQARADLVANKASQ